MKKKLLFLFTLAALLGALCFSAGAIKADRPYKESKTVKIIDHVVYEYRNSPNQRPKKQTNSPMSRITISQPAPVCLSISSISRIRLVAFETNI